MLVIARTIDFFKQWLILFFLLVRIECFTMGSSVKIASLPKYSSSQVSTEFGERIISKQPNIWLPQGIEQRLRVDNKEENMNLISSVYHLTKRDIPSSPKANIQPGLIGKKIGGLLLPTTNLPSSTRPSLPKEPLKNEQMELALNNSGIKCGTVPLYEKLYHSSINDSHVKAGDFRILHGLDSVPGEWPWIVRIRECPVDEECGTCTGTLLNSRWLITAGHCGFKRSSVDKYSATFALYDLVSPDNTSFSVAIDKLVVHPDYKDLNNDLTLIRLAKPVIFNDYVQPACLIRPTRDVLRYTKGKKCYNVGYGLTDGMVDAIKLQKLRISAKNPSDCNSDQLGSVQLKRGTVCIGPADGEIGGSCKGDSGGPDLCYDPELGQWVIFGTVSYGPSDCDRESDDKWLTVSVDLSNYRTWILSTILAYSD